MRLLFGTAGTVSRGIYAADWDPATGEIGEVQLAAELARPTFLAITTRGPAHIVYAVSEIGDHESTLTAFTTIAGSRELRAIGAVATRGGHPTHVAVAPDGRAVFCANYSTGSASSFAVLDDGSLSASVSQIQLTGSGPDPQRQDRPHAHAVTPSPDGRWLLVNDLGTDRIFVFAADHAVLSPAGAWTAAPGSGPRHLAFHPDGRWVYSVNELTSTVDCLAWDARTGTLVSMAPSVSTLPPGAPAGRAFAGEIVCAPDGRHLYVSNRIAEHTIAVFRIDPATGALAIVELAANRGRNPRHIALDPAGRWLVVSNAGTGMIAVFARDPQTGRLVDTDRDRALDTVMFAGFVGDG